MRTLVLALTGALAVCFAYPAFAAKVVTKYGTYEGGCTGGSCLYKSGSQKSQHPMKKHHTASK